jgi:2-polyprenyl-6-methoxyphenol hydroxylase-like FAD-dependent oxidoreductase
MTPNLGQGANSAMADAVVFINLLSECGGERSWQQAGQRYQQVRKPFVTRIQKAAWFGGQIADWRSAPARGLRDALFRLVGGFAPMRHASMRLTAGYNPAEQAYLRGGTSLTS